jgi:hypothetical protein
MKEDRLVKGVFVGVLIGASLVHPVSHTETTRYVPVTPIVHNGGQVATSTASAMLIDLR